VIFYRPARQAAFASRQTVMATIIYLNIQNLFCMENIAAIRAIENKHVQRLTGKKQRACSRIIAKIKKKLGKLEGEDLTIAEYTRYKGLNVKDVCLFLGIIK
jgi:hypothetical protein